MKKIFLLFIIIFSINYIFSQYKVGIGFYINSDAPFKSEQFFNPESNFYELSLKFTTPQYECYDIIAGLNKDYFRFTIMKELHRQLFYPVDLYYGLGLHFGSWSKSYIKIL